ncbi:AvrD family protein [Agromyces sp. NPDC058104]|uniref:AvrD family protein n=1 Tax=Agromyces sp. NPDC058104 TaxID=3346342 RepID=UPI0036DAAE29
MATRMPNITTEADGFERLLGPASSRYFGSGFRRTRYEIDTLRIGDPGDAQASAVGRVHYPDDWSIKAGTGSLTPHLSTVDAAILSAKMMETTLAVIGLSAGQIGEAWVDSMSIRAGARPLESLAAVPLNTRLSAQTQGDDDVSTTFESRIGSLAVTARIRHARPSGPARYPSEVDMEGPLSSYYQTTQHQTRLDDLDVDQQTIRCHHAVLPGVGRGHGLESRFWPAPTLIDCLVLAGQMAQSLIYAIEHVNRTETSNLWMRRASFEASAPNDRMTRSDAIMRLIDRTSMSRGDRPLSGVTVEVPNLFGVRVTAALAYFGSSLTSAG